jgi:hypothetical protein
MDMHIPWNLAALGLRTVTARIGPALDSSLPWLEFGGAHVACGTDSAGE